MSINLVTGHTGTSHVTSEQAGSYNAGVIGTGKYVLKTKNQFSYDLISNNLIRVQSGDIFNQGRHISIDLNDYEELTIDNGLQGVKRNDIIVARYRKNPDTDIESCTLVVVKGVSGDTAIDPDIIKGDILKGDIEDDVALYRVCINGLNVEAVEKMFEMINPMDDMSIPLEDIDAMFSTTTE